jgi:hypothetical protein
LADFFGVASHQDGLDRTPVVLSYSNGVIVEAALLAQPWLAGAVLA